MELPADAPAGRAPQPPFFQVGVAKLAVMSIFTMGFYELFWSYKQWDAFRRRTGEDLNPWLRTILAMPLFFFPLFRDISKTAAARSSIRLRSPTLLASSFLLLSATVLVRTWVSFLSFLSVLPLLVVQRRINAIHAELGFDARANSRLTPLNLVGVACGAVAHGIWLWPWIRWIIATRLAL